MELKIGCVLIKSSDHCFYVGSVQEEEVVYNHNDKSWYEYAGDDYLGDGDEVVTAMVAR